MPAFIRAIHPLIGATDYLMAQGCGASAFICNLFTRTLLFHRRQRTCLASVVLSRVRWFSDRRWQSGLPAHRHLCCEH